MKVRIITEAPYPEGLATTNRVFYTAKGLKENGSDVKIYIAWPTERENNIKNIDPNGNYKGIDFEYAGGSSVRSESIFKRQIDDFLNPIKAGIKVIKDKPDAVLLLSSGSMYILFVLKILFLFTHITFIVAVAEMPKFTRKNYGIYKLRNKFLKLIMFKHLDGLLVITNELIEWYSKIISKKCPTILMPVIVDVNDIYRPEIERTRNLVYTGPLNQKKDGILTIIKSFANVAGEFKDINLIMTGNLEKSPDRQKILELINNSPYKERMILKGFVTRQELIILMNSAQALLLAKPSSDQADTCFPTKLGEYLASSNPIVITKTGEISLFLEDGVNAYIAEPDSEVLYTEKLRELLNDTEKSKKIGIAGQKEAIENFNYFEIAKKIINII